MFWRDRFKAMTRQVIIFCIVVAPIGAKAVDQTTIPADDSVVLEVLPRSLWGKRDVLVSLQSRLKENPTDALLAFQVATFFVDAGDEGSDPRFYGFARASLQPWWNTKIVPPPILRLRAKLKEKEHQYDEAIDDLLLLTRSRPDDGQAIIELVNLYRLQGKFSKAKYKSDQLASFATEVPVAISRVPLDAVSGKAEKALATLERLTPKIEADFPATMTWVRMTQAETSEILGRYDDAIKFYEDALQASPQSFSVKRAFSDLLIHQKRFDDVITMVEQDFIDDGCLLMAAVAARGAAQTDKAKLWTDQLKQRFDETRQRGDQPHRRFVTRYFLDLTDNPKLALSESLANWANQKELVDARLVLRSAIADRRPESAQPVIDFLRECKCQDAASAQLISELEKM